MFKLIAIKPLVGCDRWVKKCLSDEDIYYFCNEYDIDRDGKECRITYRNQGRKLLCNNFFSIHNKTANNATISIGAIVGKNGDGKSTIIELLMRVLNNCIYKADVGLQSYHINGVSAELFYQVDGNFYCLKCDGTDIGINKIASLHDNEIIHQDEVIDKERWQSEFFYSFVFNFSHYAYNIYDFRREWNNTIYSNNENEKCWLHHIFHKNDAYTAPLNINPYRDKGNIDINRERTLSRQRLLSLFVNAEDGRKDENSFRIIGENDKVATYVVLHATDSSKLQERIIKERLAGYKEDFLLEDLCKEATYDENGKADPAVIKNVVNRLDDIYRDVIKDVKDEFLAIVYPDYGQKFILAESEFDKLLTYTGIIYTDSESEADKQREQLENYGVIRYYNLKQFQVFRMIHDVIDAVREYLSMSNEPILTNLKIAFDRHSESLDFLTKPYEEMCAIEKALHYIIYKIISTFETYDEYNHCLASYQNDLCGQSVNLSKPVSRLFKDVIEERSHITLKIRQIINYICRNIKDYGIDDNHDEYTKTKILKEEVSTEILSKLYDETEQNGRFLVYRPSDIK